MSWLCYVEPRRFSSPPCTSPHLPCKILRPVAKNEDTGQLLTVGADVSDLNPPSPSSPHCATPSLPARVVWRHRWASVPMLSPALAGGARSPTAPSVTVTQRASERRRVHHPRASCMRRPLRRPGGPDIRRLRRAPMHCGGRCVALTQTSYRRACVQNISRRGYGAGGAAARMGASRSRREPWPPAKDPGAHATTGANGGFGAAGAPRTLFYSTARENAAS
ncbi:hypothetical protein A9K55_001532 [Cordyceps militaris]|uniref:Uncharacterized protein n=1 Tax=Cordyceps militaris TaxID=73501 RepID=A0A2H4SRI1_CORMI|nr:hypothetical protein A9K55_001532 [Cordyceps militaris]